jgi:crotonobetainyl-CoA:carnitine CoA-transferase CaiB-like acyl-CoA transferase
VGQRVEVNLLQSLLSALTNQAASTLATGAPPMRLGNAHPSIAPYAVFPAVDRDLVIAVGNDRQFHALATLLEKPGLADDPRYATNTARVAHRDQLHAELEAALAAAPAVEWVAGLTAAGVPAGLVNDVAEALAFAESLGLDPVTEIARADAAGPHRSVANPIGLAASAPDYRIPPPALGEHDGADWLDHDPADWDPAEREPADRPKGPR